MVSHHVGISHPRRKKIETAGRDCDASCKGHEGGDRRRTVLMLAILLMGDYYVATVYRLCSANSTATGSASTPENNGAAIGRTFVWSNVIMPSRRCRSHKTSAFARLLAPALSTKTRKPIASSARVAGPGT